MNNIFHPEAKQWKTGAFPLWNRLFLAGIIILLATFSLFYIYSSGYVSADFPVRSYWQRQLVWLFIGFFLGYLMSFWDNRQLGWRVFVWSGYGFAILTLLLVLFWGRSIGGARRWFALGPLLFQPAELARLFTLLAACLVLASPKKHFSFWRLPVFLSVFLLPVFLIYLEPSLGNAASLLPCLLVLLLIRYLGSRCFAALMFLAILAVVAGISALFWLRQQPQERLTEISAHRQNPGLLHQYHLKRLRSYLSNQGDWNERQSIMAVAGGGLSGKGYLNGTMKNLGYLPRTVAATDFIFAVIAEEGGFLFGTLPILILYALLLSACLQYACRADNELDLYLCASISTLIFVHILIGIGMAGRLIPIIGLPLPLLSYGGSFNLTILLALGILMATDLHQGKNSESTLNKYWQARCSNWLKLQISWPGTNPDN